MDLEGLKLRCRDGVSLAGEICRPKETPSGTVVIAPALGIPREFYRAMAHFLAGRGCNAITFDYRGTGGSRAGAPRGPDIRLDQWGSQDIDAALGAALEQQGERLYLLGHSAGAQLFGLAPNSVHLDGLVMVSSLIPWWRSFPPPWRLRVWFLMHVIMPVFSFGRESFPARKLRISSIDVPSGVTRQWSRWGRRPDYFFDPRWGLDVSRYQDFHFPVLVCHIDDDPYAPWTAIRALLDKMPNTRQEIWPVASAEAPRGAIGHVNFFRQEMQDVFWGRISDWLAGQSAGLVAAHYD